MTDILFSDIPVYRVDRTRYYRDRDEYVQEKMYPGTDEHKIRQKQFYENEPGHKTQFEQHLVNKYGGCWEFNEVIGWIELYFLGNQIRGNYFAVNGKRVVRTRKKTFEFKTWKLAPEIDIPVDSSNQQIFEYIKEYLSDCQEEVKGRYIDVSKFDTLGLHVNWRSIMGLADKCV